MGSVPLTPADEHPSSSHTTPSLVAHSGEYTTSLSSFNRCVLDEW